MQPSLYQKLRQSTVLFEQICSEFSPSKIAVAWTGGKDSTITLHLWKNFLQKHFPNERINAINLDTGLKFPEIITFRDSISSIWGINLFIARPEKLPNSYPIAQDAIDCCSKLKVEPLSKAVRKLGYDVLLTGIRKDEHPDRDRDIRERRKKPDCLMVHPILHFTEMDVWAYHQQEKLPYCPLYSKGYRSLGCMPCTQVALGQNERAGRAPQKEENMETLRALGYF